MDKQKIEVEVAYLHKEIYRARREFFKADAHPLTMLRPEVAAEVLGMDYVRMERIQSDLYGMEVAGLLDLPGQAMFISQHFNYRIQRFTALHECGHVLLHPHIADGQLMHRDLPNPDMHTYRRSEEDQDADYFAACFLMPVRTLHEEFSSRFGKPPLRLTHDIACHVGGRAMSDLQVEPSGGLRFPMAVATRNSFNGFSFESLADRFQVSPKAMAIRLRELALTRD